MRVRVRESIGRVVQMGYDGIWLDSLVFIHLQRGVPPGCRGVRSEKTPEIDVSRAVDILNAQAFCLTPSELRERVT